MVLDPRKRQKNLERKASKRKAQLKGFSQQYPADLRTCFRNSAAAPVVHSLATSTLWENGIGHVLLSREVRPGQIAFSAFLVDMYCLGVKDAMWGVRSQGEVDSLAEKLVPGGKIVKLKPECARHLVEGAVEYARNLGFPPHDDYQTARLIFGDIDAAACTEAFVYGRDGKPHFIAGPYDTPQRSRQIIDRLNTRLGPQGHHFLVPATAADLVLADLELDDDEGDEDE